jgi:hypothetical protein
MPPQSPIPQTEDTKWKDYSEDGVDLTLIRWMLSLTPAQRLQVLQENIDSIQELLCAPPTV